MEQERIRGGMTRERGSLSFSFELNEVRETKEKGEESTHWVRCRSANSARAIQCRRPEERREQRRRCSPRRRWPLAGLCRRRANQTISSPSPHTRSAARECGRTGLAGVEARSVALHVHLAADGRQLLAEPHSCPPAAQRENDWPSAKRKALSWGARPYLLASWGGTLSLASLDRKDW